MTKQILIIEDETDLRTLYAQILQQAGFTIEQAIDGEEGYLKLSKKDYDLILLDIILPKLDGLQMLDKLKADHKAVKGKIVLLTNLSQELVVSKAMEYNINGYMVKSDLTPDQIVQEVKNYLDGQKAVTAI
ncbi:MAG TPA: response regulator [Candidatus Woesebacteria bacterium]|nr:response regulator [Candidatus Woesebacteria bacterium]